MNWLPIVVLLPLVPAEPPEIQTHSVQLSEPEEDGDEGERDDQIGEETVDDDDAGADRRSRSPEIGVDLTVASTYVYRGELQYSSPMVPSFQPSIWLDFDPLLPGALEVSVWSAIAMSDRARIRRLGTANEVDFAVTYSNAVAQDWLELTGGLLYYIYPGAEVVDGEKELTLDIAIGNLPLTIAVALFMELHPGLGLAVEPRVGWERSFGNVNVGMDIIMGASFYRDEGSSLDHATLTAQVSQEVGRLSFGVSLSYTLQIAPPGLDFLERSIIWGALSAGFSR